MLFLLPAVLMIIYTAIGSPGLPTKYHLDSFLINNIAMNLLEADGSFKLIGDFYRLIGLSGNEIGAAVFSLVCYYFMVGLVYFKYAPKSFTGNQLFLIAMMHVMGAVYFGQMTKELVVLTVPFFAFLPGLGKIPYWIKIVLPILFISVYFRNYWLIVLVFFIVLIPLFSSRKNLFTPRNLVFVYVLFLVVTIAYQQFVGMSLQQLRSNLNYSRMDSENAVTLIQDFVTGEGPQTAALNFFVTFVLLVIPLPLLADLDLLHGLFALGILAIWLPTIRLIAQNKSFLRKPMEIGVLSLLVAFLMTQAVFEPDFGSSVKHWTPIMPFFLYAAFAVRKPVLTPSLHEIEHTDFQLKIGV